MIDLEAARALLDFGKRIGEGPRAEEQLRGAVAIHNLLRTHGVAYLADEVGMGKTYDLRCAGGAGAVPPLRARLPRPRGRAARKHPEQVAARARQLRGQQRAVRRSPRALARWPAGAVAGVLWQPARAGQRGQEPKYVRDGSPSTVAGTESAPEGLVRRTEVIRNG